MSDTDSLILGNGAQLQLVDVDEAGVPAAAYQRNESAGKFTGERIFSGNPKLYRAIVNLLGRDLPYREISEICGVSVNTVCAVAMRERIPVETIRERIGKLALDVAALTMETARDMLADPVARAKLSGKDLLIMHGIAFQNAQLALGGATARMDVVDKTPAPTHSDYERLLRNVTGTGLSGETPDQKRALGAGNDGAIEVATSTPADTATNPNT